MDAELKTGWEPRITAHAQGSQVVLKKSSGTADTVVWREEMPVADAKALLRQFARAVRAAQYAEEKAAVDLEFPEVPL